MKFRDLFEEVEDWFWKLEFNPENNTYELFLGIPNDWIYSGNGKDISIDLVHEMNENSIIKITTLDENLSIDDVIDTAKLLVSKNKELEKKKEEHRIEMEKLKDMLIEKEKSFLEYIDTVKDTKGDGIVTSEKNDDVTEEIVIEVEKNESLSIEDADNFIKDIEKTKN